MSGDELTINELGLTNANDKQIVKFSKSFQKIKTSLENKDYTLIKSNVRFILFWKYNHPDTDEELEVKIVLPELVFEKTKIAQA